MKKIISVIMVLIMVCGLVSCRGNVAKARPGTIMSQDEYIKMQRMTLKNQSFKIREVKEKMVEWYDVDDETKDLLWNKTLKLIDNYKTNRGFGGETGDSHEYLKLNMDNLIVVGNPKYKIVTSDGYYYVNVIFNTKHQNEVVEFNEIANYVGIRGAIKEDENGNLDVDKEYLRDLLEKVNINRAIEGKDLLQNDIGEINFQNDVILDMTEKATKSNVVKKEQRRIRRLDFNSREFNSVGIAKNVIPEIPSVNAIITPLENNDLAGYSLYKEGEGIKGLRKGSGELNVTFVYKHDLEEDTYKFYTMYLGDYNSGESISKDDIIVPSYKREELEKLIEEMSRSYANGDEVALTCGELIYPQDLGLKLLLQRNVTALQDEEWYINDILREENGGMTYILDLEQLTTEQSEGTTTNGINYIRRYYARCEIVKNKFVITDLYQYSTKLLRIPEMDVIKGINKKMYATKTGNNNLTDETKEKIRETLRRLGISVSIKKGTDMYDEEGNIVVVNDKEQWGMNDRFNNDRTMLDEDTYDLYINEMQGRAIKYGTNTKCEAVIKINEWLGGNDKQVELITNEIYDYGEDGTYVSRYMLLSNFKNTWVIDEMQIIEEKDLSKANTRTIKSSLGN